MTVVNVRDLAEYEILHLATHAVADDQSPWNSRILLEGREEGLVLRAHQVAREQLDARLAVLSSCRSAASTFITGEGTMGLGSAFLSAGVPVVVATLWPVHDQSTAALMQEFYSGLERGETAATALRLAQLELADDDETAHPAHWAGLHRGLAQHRPAG